MSSPLKVRVRAAALAAAVAVLAGAPLAHAAPLANLPQPVYTFTGGDTGAQPNTGLVLAKDGYFYGTTESSVAYNSQIIWNYYGGIYRVKPDGSGFQMMHTFTGKADSGLPAAKVLVAKDGAVYGTASSGQLGHAGQYGTIWKLTTDGAFSVLHTFGGPEGAYPGVALIQDPASGLLYGATGGGGSGNHGVIFSIKTDGSAYKVRHEFFDDVNGATPIGLVFGTDGNLYGATARCFNCGTENYGTTFSMKANGSAFKVLHRFDPAAGEGQNPHSGLVQVGNYFYGTTNGGGKYGDDMGTVYRFDAKGHFNTVLSLQYLVEGSYPTSGLTVGANGNLYGTTTGWGPDQFTGTFYEITPKGQVVGVEPLTDVGYQAQADLAVGPDGRLYAPLLAGGTWSAGSIVSVAQAFDPVPAPAPAVDFHLSPQPPVITLGQSATLTWTVTDADTCTASGSWAGNKPLNGTEVETPTATGQYTYTLTCTNKGTPTTVSNNLFVNPAQ